MKLQFSNVEEVNKFLDKIKADGYKININGEDYRVSGARVNYTGYSFHEVDIKAIHIPKRVYPKLLEMDIQYYKDLRQRNSSLLKYTEQAVTHFVQSGQLAKYLEKYNSDGSVK